MSVLHELTNEQIAAFKDCKTREEMIAKANELGIKYTEEDIEAGFKVLHPEEAEASGEIDDDALDAVAGGGCGYASDGRRIVDMGGRCHTSFEYKDGCGNNVDMGREKCRICGEEWRCYNCVSVSFEGGKMYCNNPAMGK